MDIQLEELKNRIAKMSDKALMTMLMEENESYTPEASELAQKEFERRKLSSGDREEPSDSDVSPQVEGVVDPHVELTPKKPFLISTGMVISFISGAYFLVVALNSLFVPEASSFTIDERQVTREFFMESFGYLVILLLITANILISLAYGFWKNRSWTRKLVIIYWIVSFFGIRDLRDLTFPMMGLCISIWYFYIQPNVVRYYEQATE